jgi:hypothetical protein
MSRHSIVLGKGSSPISLNPLLGKPSPVAAPVEAETIAGEYVELIRRLFHGPAAVAVIGGQTSVHAGRVSQIAQDLAERLSASGKRVVVVPIGGLLGTNLMSLPDEPACLPGSEPRVWVWPPPAGREIEFFKSRESGDRVNWLDSLRQKFDSVLLDCPNVEEAPGVSEVAAMADAAVLVAQAGATSKQQIQQDCRALQLRGARVVGCILIQRS